MFGPDAEEDLGQPAQRHDGRSDEEADGHQVGIATVDQVAELEWAGDSAHGGSDGEERRDGPRQPVKPGGDLRGDDTWLG
ncbi:hypothetical protein [Streptomyces sp. Z38]|uniref:hypothetical protein n=1 Tax=Streptomyces sp. Z38 TaxID=2682780 RepID=UPI001E44A6D7|nr:hypothetical protein [Streptomyces sp. Z38]